MANSAVPPKGKRAAAIESEPGHISDTENPHTAQPISARNGAGESAAVR